jgi:acyl carrier protein
MNDRANGNGLGRSEIVGMVVSSLEDVLAMADGDSPSVEDIGEDTRLLGRKGVLDSMGLVTLIVDVEQRLEEEYGAVVVLADERAMSQKRSPFRTVGTLSDYIHALASA